MPLFFWGDPDGARYRDSYFSMYPGIWRHGDWIEITSRGTAIIYGRSDSTINRGGVRMGTSEIYRAVLGVAGGRRRARRRSAADGTDGWMPLFVVLARGRDADRRAARRDPRRIREDCSPRHVPDEIRIAEVPRTLSGKVLEVPVKRILTGTPRRAGRQPRVARESARPRPVRGDGRRRRVTQPPKPPPPPPLDPHAAARAGGALRRANNRPGLVRAIRAAREALPGDENFGDELSTAGDKPSEVIARFLAEQGGRDGVIAADGSRGGTTASTEAGLAALQLWQALSQRVGRGAGVAEATILFTDLVGFSSWVLEAGDEAALMLLRAVAGVVEPAIHTRRGRVVKRLGDGHMAVFAHPGAGVEAALAMQAGLADVEVDGHRPRLRAGLHRGVPRQLGGDYLGTDVNIAARVSAAARSRRGAGLGRRPRRDRAGSARRARLQAASRVPCQGRAPRSGGVPRPPGRVIRRPLTALSPTPERLLTQGWFSGTTYIGTETSFSPPPAGAATPTMMPATWPFEVDHDIDDMADRLVGRVIDIVREHLARPALIGLDGVEIGCLGPRRKAARRSARRARRACDRSVR